MNLSDEELVNAILWKLYILHEVQNKDNYREICKIFVKEHQDRAFQICMDLAAKYRHVFQARLGLLVDENSTTSQWKSLEKVWGHSLELLLMGRDSHKNEVKDMYLSDDDVKEFQDCFRDVIRQALLSKSPDLPNLPKDSSLPIQSETGTSPTTQGKDRSTTRTPSERETETTSPVSNPANDARKAVNQPSAYQDRSSSDNQEVDPQPTAQWKYLPVPENDPDRHDEFDTRCLTTPEGLKLIGARVRGKKHKHEGTNCDDWFEFVVSGSWTIIAVSDGAGSKKFSRVGAKISCEAAVKHLAEALQNHKINERESWSADTFKRDLTTGEFAEQDLEFVQKALHEAMQVAYDAVQDAAAEREKLVDYYEILGNRRLEIRDLSATLLLAVHTTVKYKEKDYSLVLTCQVGDGMTAAVYQEDRKGQIELLGTPDSGEFAGQTDFLTSKEKLSPDNLMRKTFPFFRPLQALMMMTDGVADDYFPPDPGMLQLYGDLLLNRAIDFRQPTDDEIAEKLRWTHLDSAQAVKDAKKNFGSEVERITDPEDIPQKVWIRSVADYAKELDITKELDVTVAEVVAAPELLAAGSAEEQMWEEAKDKTLEEKLRIWLDSYNVKGSFDDRTLVVLYREVV